MSYTPEEVKKFEECKDAILEKIHEYYTHAHNVTCSDHYRTEYCNRIVDSIVKLMEFEKLVNW